MAANDTELTDAELPNDRLPHGAPWVLTKDQERQVFRQLTEQTRRLFALSMQSPWGLSAFDELYEKYCQGGTAFEDIAANASGSALAAEAGNAASIAARAGGTLCSWRSTLRRLHRRGARLWSSPASVGGGAPGPEVAVKVQAARGALSRNREQIVAAADRAGISQPLREKLVQLVREHRRHEPEPGNEATHAHYLAAMRALETRIDRIKSHIVASNQGLVHFVMRRYCDLGMAWPDLVQEGNIGLMRAVEKFDVERGVRFNTYAVWWIRQAARRALSNQARTIRVPVHVLDARHTVTRAHARLSLELGRVPSVRELSNETGVPEHQVEELSTLTQEPLSLHAPRAPDSATSLLDVITAPDASTDDSALAADRRAAIEQLLGDLTDREQHVLRMRFGLAGHDECTLVQVGQAIGVTRERARQILQASLVKLRQAAARRKIDLSLLN